jgi:hypothetical protein
MSGTSEQIGIYLVEIFFCDVTECLGVGLLR